MLGSTAWGEANAEVCMRWVVVRVQEGVGKGVTPRELGEELCIIHGAIVGQEEREERGRCVVRFPPV